MVFALSYCFVVIIIVTGKQTNFEGRSVRFIPWAGVSTAPQGEVGTLLSQERDVMDENVTT